MNFGFDIDGTITAAPVAFGAMMQALMDAGHEVHVITGTMDADATDEHYAGRVRQLLNVGIGDSAYTHIHIVTAPHAEEKARYCVEHEIRLMFDDAPPYIDAMRAAGITVAALP